MLSCEKSFAPEEAAELAGREELADVALVVPGTGVGAVVEGDGV
jgi:hypothetical protein